MLAVERAARTCGALTAYRRYLRARRFNPQDALKQFKDTEEWRKDTQLDQLYQTIEVEEYEQTRRLVWQCADGNDASI